MSTIKLITVSDDRNGRKGGLYEATQWKIAQLLDGWISQGIWTIDMIINCDPLMQNIDSDKNGRVYKPWVIREALSVMREGDFLIYNDCSPEMWPDEIDLSKYDLEVIKRLTEESNGLLVGFVKWSDKHLEPGDLGIHTHRWFSLDNWLNYYCDDGYRDSFLCASGMICIKKSAATFAIVNEWLDYNRMAKFSCRNISEHEDSYFDPGTMGKLGNRHDQSILSLILNTHDWNYCDIVYNDLNPYNFLNFCLPGHDYKFINSNTK